MAEEAKTGSSFGRDVYIFDFVIYYRCGIRTGRDVGGVFYRCKIKFDPAF
jgi:hypothetical protein